MENKLIGNENDIIFYTDEDGNTKIQVILQDKDVGLNTEAIANLFDVQRSGITKHINNIYKEDELRKLNKLTTLFLDYAKSMEEDNQVMTIKDWINEMDILLKFRKEEI